MLARLTETQHFGIEISNNMAIVQTLSLSSLTPINFYYGFGDSNEPLRGEVNVTDSNLIAKTYEVFKNIKDVSISKNTVLALTEKKDLKKIFSSEQETIDAKSIAGTFYLKTPNKNLNEDETTVRLWKDYFYAGGKGETSVFHIIPVKQDIVELKANGLYLHVSENYPYDLVASTEPLLDEYATRKQFYLVYDKNTIVIQTLTKEGLRYLACSSDRKLRFVGVNLNQAKINDYRLIPTFVSSPSLVYNFNPSTAEVKYFNEISETNNQKTVNIKSHKQSDTNLLVSCPSLKMTESSEVDINISLLKTNFSAAGTFNTTL